MLIETIIRKTIEIREDVLTLRTGNDVRQNIYSRLISEANQFDTVRQNETTQALVPF